MKLLLTILAFCLLPVCNGQSVLDIRPPAKSVHSISNAWRQQQREESQKQRDAIKAGEARMAHLRILNAEEKSRQDRRKHFLARKAALQSPKNK